MGRVRVSTKKERLDRALQKTQNLIFKELEFRTTSDSKVWYECKVCQYSDITNYNNIFYNKFGCKQCSYKEVAKKVSQAQRIPYDDIIKALNKASAESGYTYTFDKQDYKNQNSIVHCYCPNHNYKWDTSVKSLLRGSGCFYCGRIKTANKRKHSQEYIENKIKEVSKGQYTCENLTYSNMNQMVEARCVKGHKWRTRLADLIFKGTGCSKCAKAGISKSEKELCAYIEGNCSYVIMQNTRDIISPYELDIYIPDLRLAFEFNGIYWHSDDIIAKRANHKFQTAKEYHDYKTEQCEKLGVKLIHIDEREWLDNKQNVLEFIKANVKTRPQLNTPQARKLEKLKRKYKDLEFLTGYVGVHNDIVVRYKNIQDSRVWRTTPELLRKGLTLPQQIVPMCDKSLIEFIKTLYPPFKVKGIQIQCQHLILNLDTNTPRDELIAMTEQYKAKGKYVLHINEAEWQNNQESIKFAINRILNKEWGKGNDIAPYHLYPDYSLFFKGESSVCGIAYRDHRQKRCKDLIKQHLDSLEVAYKQDGNDFISDMLIIRFIPVIDYQKYKTNDLNRFINQAKIRTMLIFETQLTQNEHQWQVMKSNIAQALGKTKNRIYARDLECIQVEPRSLKEFYKTNQMYGYCPAKVAFCLRHKSTKEVMMAYMFNEGYYKRADVALVRGASKLNYIVVGGATKLWKHAVAYYKAQGKKNIVYYVDLNIHNGNSLTPIGAEAVATQRGLWNFWFDMQILKNREPYRHKEIKELQKQGKLMPVYNAGTRTYLYTIDGSSCL